MIYPGLIHSISYRPLSNFLSAEPEVILPEHCWVWLPKKIKMRKKRRKGGREKERERGRK